MRSKPDQSKRLGIWQLIDQDEVWFDMAIAVIFPCAGQRVIAKSFWQRSVRNEQR